MNYKIPFLYDNGIFYLELLEKAIAGTIAYERNESEVGNLTASINGLTTILSITDNMIPVWQVKRIISIFTLNETNILFYRINPPAMVIQSHFTTHSHIYPEFPVAEYIGNLKFAFVLND